MRNRYSMGRRASAFAGILTLAIAAVAAGGAFAQSAGEDEDDTALDTKIFRRVMKEMGFRSNEVGIEYRERAPLVVPPNRNLPPPQNEGAATNIPAWPKDPDVARRKEATAAEKAKLKRYVDVPSEDGRPLRPDELTMRGQAAPPAATGSGVAGPTAEEAARPLSPSQLNGGTKNWFDEIFSSIGPARPEMAPFKGEPPRTTMTAPPPGYQTPSSGQPYGIDIPREATKPSTVEQRMEAQR
jgi:hypothetical protein